MDLHGLRRTMITELIAVGVDPRTVMGRAGHRSAATTLTIYAKVRPVVDPAAAEMWGQILNDKLTELRAAVVDEVADDSVTSAARSASGVGFASPAKTYGRKLAVGDEFVGVGSGYPSRSAASGPSTPAPPPRGGPPSASPGGLVRPCACFSPYLNTGRGLHGSRRAMGR
ncbi:MAG: hypothetical protein ACYC1D_05840 [Acidimicrobiales bacterium]